MSMTPITPNPLHLRLATLLILGSLAAPSGALTLGEVELQSYVGQPLRANVPFKLNDGEVLTPDCVSLLSAHDDLPGIGSASLTLNQHGSNRGELQIRSDQNIGEPTVGFGIKINCNAAQLSRSFTVFLNVAPANEPVATLNKSAPASNKTNDVPTRELETLVTKKSTTLSEIAKKYYPESTPQYPRYLKKLTSANPEYDADTPIASGTEIIIPDRLRSMKKPIAKAQQQESGLLRLENNEAPRAKTAAPNPADYTRELEQKVATLQDLQQKMQLEISQLNLRLAQLNAASEPVAAIASAVAPAVAVASSVASAPLVIAASHAAIAPTETHAASAPIRSTDSNNSSLWLGLAALLAVAVGGAWYIVQRRAKQSWDEEELTQAPAIHPLHAPRGDAGAASQHTMLSMLHLGHAQQGIEVHESVENEMARAQLLIAQGETMEAIDVLYHCIDEDPEDIERWLMLFRLFRQQGMKTEYAHLAQSLKLIPHDDADWELVRNIGAKLEPENPLYARTHGPAPVTTALHAIDPAPSSTPDFGPLGAEIEMDLAPPVSPNASLLATMTQESAIPPQYSSLLIKTDTPDYALDLPDLDSPGVSNRVEIDDNEVHFSVEELELNPVDEAQFDEPKALSSELELSPIEPSDKKKPL